MPEIVARRTVPADDGTHAHIDLVGYRSSHLAREPIFVTVERLIETLPLMERYWIERAGERIAVEPGECAVCGYEPHLRTEKDPPGGTLILELPEA